MTFLIIGVIIFVLLVAISVSSTKKNEQAVNEANGGLRKKYIEFSSFLEKDLKMDLIIDSGLKFYYEKKHSDFANLEGKLQIGIEHSYGKDLVFSNFLTASGQLHKGVKVANENLKLAEDIKWTLRKSLEDLETSKKMKLFSIEKRDNSFQKDKIIAKTLTDSSTSTIQYDIDENYQQWISIKGEIKGEDNSKKLEEFIDELFIPNKIDVEKWSQNLDLLNPLLSYKKLEGNFGTKSMASIYYFDIPPAFNKVFIAAFPDVFNWFQDKFQKEDPKFAKLNLMTEQNRKEYIDDHGFKTSILKAILIQYKKEFKSFEVS